MKGFEILVNGRKRKFLPVSAEAFSNFQIGWLVTPLPSDYICITAMRFRKDGSAKNPVVWQTEDIKAGDEITVRVVNSPASRKPVKRVKRCPRGRA